MNELTIIIPHYNSPRRLEILLGTIPMQENVQVIVVDDRSNLYVDEYNELTKKMKYAHVLFLKNTNKTKGAGTCRNIGLRHARGKWILFADSDDLFTMAFYETIEKYFSMECDVVFFTPTSMDVDTGLVSKRHIYYKNIITRHLEKPSKKSELEVRFLISPPWSKLINREFLENNQIQFDEVLVSNDIAFSTKIGLHLKNFYLSDDVIYCVTSSRSSLTKQYNESNYNTRLDIFLWRYDFLKANLSKKEFKLLDKINLLACKELLSSLKYELGFKKFAEVLKLYRKRNVSVVHIQYLNPVFWYKNIATVMFALSSHRKFAT